MLNLQNEGTSGLINIPNNVVINLSGKPLSTSEQSILSKGAKFAPTPSEVPHDHKIIVAEIEAAITNLPDESIDSVVPKVFNIPCYGIMDGTETYAGIATQLYYEQPLYTSYNYSQIHTKIPIA